VGHVRCDPLRILAPQRDARLRDIHPNDGVPIRAMADEFTGVVVEAAAPRTAGGTMSSDARIFGLLECPRRLAKEN